MINYSCASRTITAIIVFESSWKFDFQLVSLSCHSCRKMQKTFFCRIPNPIQCNKAEKVREHTPRGWATVELNWTYEACPKNNVPRLLKKINLVLNSKWNVQGILHMNIFLTIFRRSRCLRSIHFSYRNTSVCVPYLKKIRFTFVHQNKTRPFVFRRLSHDVPLLKHFWIR